jgi:hypothetical protein
MMNSFTDPGTTSSASFQPTLNLEATSAATPPASAGCMYIEPGPHGYVPAAACNSNWNYNPNVGLAAFMAVLFGLSFIAHIIQAWYFKKFKLAWTLLMGISWETLGFLLRLGGALDQQNRSLATVQQALILLAPLWLNAFDYVLLGRMMLVFLPELKILRVRATWIAGIFVCLDLIAFLIQASAALFLAPGNTVDQVNTGMTLYMAGICLQQVYIVIFLSFVGMFHYRALQVSDRRTIFAICPSWQTTLIAIYASLVLITVRIIFRLREFSGGLDPYANSIPYHEQYFYVCQNNPTKKNSLLLTV